MTANTEAASNCRVLFVDDDAFYRDLAAETLRGAGLAHVVVPDGGAAFAQLETGKCDLVVLDLSMPGQSGFEIAEAIRKDQRFADLPIIVITGNDDDATLHRAFEIGATSFMAKPLNWSLFVQHVKFVLKAAEARSALLRAQRTAEFMSDLKSRMIGTLVTEFQTPLRSALGFARLLKEQADGPLPNDYPAWAEELHTALERLGAVHLKLLNFGRAAGQQIELDDHPVDVAAVVASCVARHEVAARRRNVNLLFDDCLHQAERHRMDAILISNAISGILENSVKFTPRGGDVIVKLSLQSDAHFVIAVSDGVPPMSQTQIDEVLGNRTFAAVRSEAVEHLTAAKICRALVEAHSGEMRMQAGPNGMVTTIRLPKDRSLTAQLTQRPRPLLRRAS